GGGGGGAYGGGIYTAGGGGGGYSGGGGGDGGGIDSGGGGDSFILARLTNTLALPGVRGAASGPGENGLVTVRLVTANGVTFGYSGSIQTYVVPTDGTYIIDVWGAQGGGSLRAAGGYGAEVGGDIYLNAGTVLELVVGGAGLGGSNPNALVGGGGGGGSFVYASIPEPATWAMIGLGFAAFGLMGFRASRGKAPAAV
ncbi:MAG TPA: glycine-rich protein, partial [Roseiarcus sp.]|nr:glycine-rich protein [Roseiarcus sp.]